jgi:hypothetical protein
VEILVDTGEEEGVNMEDEGEEETMVGEMEMEAVLSLEGKGAVVIHQTGETVSLGVAVKAPRHVMKIRLPPGTAQMIQNCLEVSSLFQTYSFIRWTWLEYYFVWYKCTFKFWIPFHFDIVLKI